MQLSETHRVFYETERSVLLQLALPEFFYRTARTTEGLAEQQCPLLTQIVHWQIQLWQRAVLWHQGLLKMLAALTRQLTVKETEKAEKYKKKRESLLQII